MPHRTSRASLPLRALIGIAALPVLTATGCTAAGTGTATSAPPVAAETPQAPPTSAAPAEPPLQTPPAQPEAEAATDPQEAPQPDGVPDDAQPGVIEHVTDGDTIHVRIDDPGGPLPAAATHTVRLLEMDTPETKHPQRGVECWGPEASAFTARELAVGSTVYLVADEEDTDRYGRFLRYVWTEDGVLFNERAVREGHARAVLYEPNDAHIKALRAAEADARAAGRGMWGACDADAPEAAGRPEPPAAPAPEAAPEPAPAPGGGCEPGYDPCVPAYPPDLDCADLDGPIAVSGPDPHSLDGDGDGRGCEG